MNLKNLNKYPIILIFFNIIFHFIPFERKSLAPDDYSLLTYKRNSENYFLDFFERPIQLYYFDFQYWLIGESAFFGFLILLLTSSILIVSVYYFILLFVNNNKISFIFSSFYLVFYSKLAIYNNLINAHIILVASLYIFSLYFFIKYSENKKKLLLSISVFLYLISIFFYEIGIFLPIILLFYYKKISVKILSIYFILMIIYIFYRLVGSLYFPDTTPNHTIIDLENIFSSLNSFINIYIGRSAIRIILYGLYQYINLPIFLLISLSLINILIVIYLYVNIKKMKLENFAYNFNFNKYLLFILIFIIFSIPNLLGGSFGERHTILSSLGLILLLLCFLANFKNLFKNLFIIFFSFSIIISQGNAWSQTVATRINASVYNFLQNHQEELKSKNFIIFDKLSFKENINHELVYNKKNIMNTYFGAQVFEDWGINGMINLAVNDDEFNQNIIVIDKGYEIQNNYIIFNESEIKYSINLNKVFLVNFDNVYKNGFNNGNVK